MFFLLSKVLRFALSPLLWLVLLVIAALLARQPRRQRQWLGTALLLLLILGNGGLANLALHAWELPPVTLSQVPSHDAVVLLTGITNTQVAPHDRTYLGPGADRLTNALWLYRAGKARRIIISGGSGDLGGAVHTEAAELATLLRLAAVPAQDILLEERSRNTHENALYTKELLAAHPDVKSLILVTSAFHQRRARACFARVGLPCTTFPADFRSSANSALMSWLVPSEGALVQWSLLLQEVTGYLVYKVQGYV